MIPTGRDAVRAWRQLPPETRRAIRGAARRGVPAPDPGLALVAAGYGRTVAHRLRILRLVSPFLWMPLMCPAAVALGLSGAGRLVRDLVVLLAVGCLVLVLVGSVVVQQRHQRLYGTNLPVVEAAETGTGTAGHLPGPVPGQLVGRFAGPVAGPGESQFTVPYAAYQQVPQSGPGPFGQPAPPAVPGEVYEIRIHRGRVVFSLVFLILAGLGLFGCGGATVALEIGAGKFPVAILAPVVGALLLYAGVRALLANVPHLRDPAVVRFTTEGWQLPGVGLRGTWGEVRAVHVHPLGRRRGTAALAEIRVVALLVDDPQRYLAQLGRLRRRSGATSLRRFGSPISFMAHPRSTAPVVEVIWQLRRYTTAPISWM